MYNYVKGDVPHHFRDSLNDKMNDEIMTPPEQPADIPAMEQQPFEAMTPPPPEKKKKKKRHSLGFRIFNKLMAVIATTLLSLFLVMIITGTIVATALTVYVLDFMEIGRAHV